MPIVKMTVYSLNLYNRYYFGRCPSELTELFFLLILVGCYTKIKKAYVHFIIKNYVWQKMNVRHAMGVLNSFSIKNMCYDKMDLKLFYFHVTNCYSNRLRHFSSLFLDIM